VDGAFSGSAGRKDAPGATPTMDSRRDPQSLPERADAPQVQSDKENGRSRIRRKTFVTARPRERLY
jgi:hypothetical protein